MLSLIEKKIAVYPKGELIIGHVEINYINLGLELETVNLGYEFSAFHLPIENRLFIDAISDELGRGVVFSWHLSRSTYRCHAIIYDTENPAWFLLPNNRINNLIERGLL